MSERRAHPRVKGPFEGFWDGSTTRAGRISDLSVGGCFIESLTPQPHAGQHITVSIAVSGGQINLPGEVIYIEGAQGFAVKFVDPPGAAIEVLRKEVARLLA